MHDIDRASATDWVYLTTDTGHVPGQIGVLLRFDPDQRPGGADLRSALAQRVAGVRRLRQRLVVTPSGCGGPIWVDDPTFRVDRHVTTQELESAGDEALLDAAVAAVVRRIPKDGPLWSAVLLTARDANVDALVVVMHHALADGVGGLGLLARLVDEGGPPAPPEPFEPLPSRAALQRDARTRRRDSVRRVPEVLRQLRSSTRGAGGLHPPRAADTSLIQGTGPRRTAAALTVARAPLREAARAADATTNDVILVAVARAIAAVLAGRGERPSELVLTVPVSGRQVQQAGSGGNLASPILVTVPLTEPGITALHQVAAQVRQAKASATGPPPIALIGWAFRALARVGAYRWYMNHQHRFHVLVSHVRGPHVRLHMAGCPVTQAIPLAMADGGNTPVAFEVLSYAGDVTLTAIVDPDHFPETELLMEHLAAALDHLIER